jgi:hypothetical protein
MHQPILATGLCLGSQRIARRKIKSTNTLWWAVPVIQYADDTILVMQANAAEVAHLKNILLNYATSTGLENQFL